MQCHADQFFTICYRGSRTMARMTEEEAHYWTIITQRILPNPAQMGLVFSPNGKPRFQ